MLFLVDDVIRNRELVNAITVKDGDLLLWVNTDDGPSTRYLDELTARVRDFSDRLTCAVIGIGDGSAMIDIHGIESPRNLTVDIGKDKIERMIDVALVPEPLWENALGPDWKKTRTHVEKSQNSACR